MNVQDLLNLANKMGIGKDKLNQAMSMANKYPSDINGLKSVINDNGGIDFLNRALKFASNPMVQAGLKRFGVTPELINGIKKDLGITDTASYTDGNDIMERLKKLK